MPEAVKPGIHIPFEPVDIPGLVAFWKFHQTSDQFPTEQGEPYTLRSQSGELLTVDDADAPLGGKALQIDEGQWLNVPRHECPTLDIHGKDGHLTVVAWVKREQTQTTHCEFIATMERE